MADHIDMPPTLPWAQSIRNNRILTIVIVVLSVLLLASWVFIGFLFPLKEKIPVYVEFQSGGNNFVRVENGGQPFSANRMLIGQCARKYVVDREAIDRMTEDSRYKAVASHSSGEVWNQFMEIYGNKQSGLFYNANLLSRSITILTDSVLTNDEAFMQGVHQVVFETTDTYQNAKNPVVVEWVATFQWVRDESFVRYDDATLNPLGFKVVKYGLSKRATR